MNKFKRYFLKLFSLILVISLLSACGRQSSDSGMNSPDGFLEGEIADGEMAYDNSYNSTKEESSEIVEGEKIISTYYMNLETLDFEKTRQELDGLIKNYKSFVENSNISFRGYEYSKNYRYGDFSIRIPKDNLENFKSDLKNIGNTTDESTNKEDVTNFYRDTESRLRLVTSKEKRLLDLLEKAVKVEDIIAIESELTNTIYEKEMLEKDLKSVDEKIDYTTLNLSLIEVRNFSNVDKGNSSLRIRLKNAFKDSFYAFKLSIENFFIWLVYAIPYIIIIVAFAILGIFFIKKKRKNKS